MSTVRLLFPTYLFEFNLLEEGLITQEYLDSLKMDMDAMRKKDPVGRRVSNQYTGWQSVDGVENRPAWAKLNRIIKNKYNDVVVPWMGVDTSVATVSLGNIWANINDKGAWNMPHRHNGCWLSGAFYVQADGDEGDFIAINKGEDVVNDYPNHAKTRDAHYVAPVSGSLLLFPSGLLHMVQPNETNKDRYSIAFNTLTHYQGNAYEADREIDPDWMRFDLDDPKVRG